MISPISICTFAAATATIVAASKPDTDIPGTWGLLGGVDTAPIQPAFLRIIGEHLYMSTFHNTNETIKDAVYRAPITDEDFTGSFASGDVELITDNVAWPNEVSLAPKDAMGKKEAIAIAGGFLYSAGALTIAYPNDGVSYRISPDDKVYFYHRAIWVDIDNDGLEDIVTTRTNFTVPPFNPSIAQTVWFKNPGQNLENTADVSDFDTWNEHLIDDGAILGGCDVHLTFADLDGDGQDEIICTHFFDHSGLFTPVTDKPSLVVMSTNSEDGWASASYPTNVERIVVTTTLGSIFDIEIEDMNGDGKLDILMSNHAEINEEALVAILELPLNGNISDTTAWTSHVIKQNFTNSVPRGMSPGGAHTFHPKNTGQAAKGKPWIVISGDGDGRAHILSPKSEDLNDWEYVSTEILNTQDMFGQPITTGSIAIDDSKKCTILYVPAFEAGRILVYDACKMATEIFEESYNGVNPWAVGGGAAVLLLLCAGGVVWKRMPQRDASKLQDSEAASTKEVEMTVPKL